MWTYGGLSQIDVGDTGDATSAEIDDAHNDTLAVLLRSKSQKRSTGWSTAILRAPVQGDGTNVSVVGRNPAATAADAGRSLESFAVVISDRRGERYTVLLLRHQQCTQIEE